MCSVPNDLLHTCVRGCWVVNLGKLQIGSQCRDAPYCLVWNPESESDSPAGQYTGSQGDIQQGSPQNRISWLQSACTTVHVYVVQSSGTLTAQSD